MTRSGYAAEVKLSPGNWLGVLATAATIIASIAGGMWQVGRSINEATTRMAVMETSQGSMKEDINGIKRSVERLEDRVVK